MATPLTKWSFARRREREARIGLAPSLSNNRKQECGVSQAGGMGHMVGRALGGSRTVAPAVYSRSQ